MHVHETCILSEFGSMLIIAFVLKSKLLGPPCHYDICGLHDAVLSNVHSHRYVNLRQHFTRPYFIELFIYTAFLE